MWRWCTLTVNHGARDALQVEWSQNAVMGEHTASGRQRTPASAPGIDDKGYGSVDSVDRTLAAAATRGRVAADADPDSAAGSGRSEWWIAHHDGVALGVLLMATAVLYLWGVTANQWSNTFYTGAAWSGSVDWTAWFFASIDPSNFTTIDKPPAALWVMGLSGRLFGFSPASMLIPQALMGVGTVAFVYAAVRRIASPGAALLAGVVVSLTPVAVTMFRYNHPDALLALLMSAGAYCLIRAMQTEIGRHAAMWLALTGGLVGLAFLTKMVSGLLVLPGFGLAYLIAGHSRLWARIAHLAGGGAALVVSAGWWVVAATIWPADSRPYIGGSTDNSVLNLIIEGNGLGRVFNKTGGVMPSSHAAPGSLLDGGSAGLDRLFGNEMGNEISWLIPCALIALLGGLIARGRAPRTDPMRGALILWGGWFAVTAVSFAYAPWLHPYYSVALAPALGGMIGTGGCALWQRRETLPGRLALSGMVTAAALTSWILLQRNPTWFPELRWIIAGSAALAAVLFVVSSHRPPRGYAATAVILAVVAGISGAGSYSVATASYPQHGPVPYAGPQDAISEREPAYSDRDGLNWGTTPTDPKLIRLLRNAGPSRWAAASNWASAAERLEVDARVPVMAIGGYFGADVHPSLRQFQDYIDHGDVRYYILSKGDQQELLKIFQPFTPVRQILQWVTTHYTRTWVGPTAVYDLTRPDERCPPKSLNC
jgi:4-amino-4-deoxy-L-arabinose transferase-like glycosyltransferase